MTLQLGGDLYIYYDKMFFKQKKISLQVYGEEKIKN